MLERLGIMYLSSSLKRDKHDVQLLITEGLNRQEIIEKVKIYDPKIIAYSIMSFESCYAITLNQMLKRRHDFLSVFGGPHPTFMPEMIENEGVDAICRGEGDIAFPRLVSRMEKGSDYYGVDNFWFKRNGKIIRNPVGPLVEDLNDLPFPDRTLIYDANPVLKLNGFKFFISMRGCPFMCSYCFNHYYNQITRGKGRILRYRSVDNVICEMRQVKEKYYLEHIHLTDDVFGLKPKDWLEEFAEKFSKEIGLPFSCNVRANLINENAVRLLKKIGCRFVSMGIECENEKIANTILKRHISNEQIKRACQIMHKYKIKFNTYNLIGLPVDDPLKVDLATLDFNISLKPAYAFVHFLYPYPKTEIEKVAVEKGLFKPVLDESNVSTKMCINLDAKLKRKISNLHKLFGIIIQFPILRPITGFLISLPLNYFYTLLYYGNFGYRVYNGLSWKHWMRTMKYYIARYFKNISYI